MAMLERLRQAHPGVTITAFDGHYRRIGDADSGILSHLTVRMGDREDTFRAEEPGRRKAPKPKAVEARLSGLIGRFAASA